MTHRRPIDPQNLVNFLPIRDHQLSCTGSTGFAHQQQLAIGTPGSALRHVLTPRQQWVHPGAQGKIRGEVIWESFLREIPGEKLHKQLGF